MQASRNTNLITIGIDVGGTNTKVGLFEKGGNLLSKHSYPTTKEGEDVLERMTRKLRGILELKGIDPTYVTGIGIGVPGPVDERGVLLNCANLDMHNVDLQARFHELLPEMQVPVAAGNDANAAALGEMWKGAGQGRKSMVMVMLGTGVGAGIICDGKIVVGNKGAAGEIGHLPVKDDEMIPCGCGNYGCLEQYVGSRNLIRHTCDLLRLHPDVPSPLRGEVSASDSASLNGADALTGEQLASTITAKDIGDAAENGDMIADLVMSRACEMIGKGLAMLAVCVAPEIILIGGGISKSGDYLLERVRASYKRRVFPNLRDVPIELSAIPEMAGMLGADYMIEHVVYGI